MYESHLRRLLSGGLGLSLLCLLVIAITAAEKPSRPMRETATVPSDKNVLKRFGAVEDYLADKRWIEAIEVLQEISQTDGRMLVLAKPGVAEGTAVYLNVATRCNILLSKLPPEGLEAYRRKSDPQARRWMERWTQTHDEAGLQRIVRETYLSSYGDDALWALGESAWDRGDLSLARLYWTQLVPPSHEVRAANLPTLLRYPDTELNLADILARLVLCTVMEGERVQAAAELKRFAELCPDSQGSLAGRQGRLVDLLQQILKESATWDLGTPLTDTTTFALNASRNGTIASTVEIGASKWSHPLPANLFPPLERPNLTPDRGPLSYHPVTFENIVFVNDAQTIWAWNLLTGDPAWPSESGTAEIYPAAPAEPTATPNNVCVGVPYYTMTIADGRLFARMGSAVTNAALNETESRSLDSELVCLDLAHGQGKLLWKIATDELIREELRQWRFEGSPLVTNGRVYIAVSRRKPQLEFAIDCLDAASGSLLWHKPVVAARGAVDDHQNRISHLLLTAGAGRIFLSTDAGAIVAVDARDGRLDWAVTYESRPLPRHHAQSSHLHQGLLPAMYHEGYLYVAPNDSTRLFCIEADSGELDWQIPQPEFERWRHLLGVAKGGKKGRLVLSGNSLWLIDIDQREVIFGRENAAGGRFFPAEQGYGRGVLAGDVILWPTRGAIKILDAATGATIGHKLLQEGTAETGGNLTVAQDMLLVAQPEKLVAYCEYSTFKQRLQREISEQTPADGQPNPLNSSPAVAGRPPQSTRKLLGTLADLEMVEGNLEAAADALKTAIDINEPADIQTTQQQRHRLMDVLRLASRMSVAEGKPDVAVQKLIEARDYASDPADLVAIQIELAQADLVHSGPAAAVGHLQYILDSDQIRDAPYRVTTAGKTASAAIAGLVTNHGQAVYAAVEERAVAEITPLLQAKNIEGLKQSLRRFPNARVTRQAWRHLAHLELQAGQFHDALVIVTRELGEASSPEERAVAFADWATTLQLAGYWRPAHNAWKQLVAEEFAAVKIEYDGQQQLAGELARKQLEQPAYQVYERSSHDSATYLDRAWSVNRGTPDSHVLGDQWVLVPDREAPALELDCILVTRSDPKSRGPTTWDCINCTTGIVRWSRPLPLLPRWLAYSESSLVVVTDRELMALALETGKELWTAPLAPATEPAMRHVVNADSAEGPMAGKPDASSKDAILIQVCFRDHWALTFDQKTGVSAIDLRTGLAAWTMMPPRGRLQAQWSCGARQIHIQCLQPSAVWTIDISAELNVTECPGPPEPWLQGPILNDASGVVMVNTNRRIECRSTDRGHTIWSYHGAMSFANADPVVWSHAGQLLATIDGSTLASIDPLSGRTGWSVGIANRPLARPAAQVVVVGDAALAASNGLLRRIHLKHGDCQWERYLGSPADQWQLAPCGELVAAWPVSDTVADPAIDRPFIVWCDARTGRILQRLNIASGETIRNVIGDSRGCLVTTDHHLTAFRHHPESRQLVTTEP
ncbi:MAG: PQQ-binding-like beta-propeller repeat protein [Planctomycetes bacterium]|nr:PQQ-binding-like beta-propeller repeat protein [Planctomycetota bacterium]